jgi:hypothetical protein
MLQAFPRAWCRMNIYGIYNLLLFTYTKFICCMCTHIYYCVVVVVCNERNQTFYVGVLLCMCFHFTICMYTIFIYVKRKFGSWKKWILF